MAPRAFTRPAIALAIVLLAAPMAGCIGADDPGTTTQSATDTPNDAENVTSVPLPDEVTGVDPIATLGPDEGLDGGYQIALEEGIAYVSSYNAGFYTVNVSDPTNPEVLAHVSDTFGHDPWILHHENRTYVANAATSSGIDFIDVTDPRSPQIVANVLGQEGTTDTDGSNVHNIAVVPGTKLIYNSRSVDTPGVDIVDASDPTNPEVLGEFNDVTCHDISFYAAEDQAFCAGVRETQIWDVSDPENPEIVTRIANPAVNIHHWAVPVNNGTTLVIGDELGGASHEALNGCPGASTTNPATGGTTTDPVGALWFYDISDPTQPVPQSWISASETRTETGACTAHFGEILDDRDTMIVGFLSGGTYTIDYADVTAPQIIDHDAVGEVVDVQVHNGYAFGVGRDHGMDVYEVLGGDE